MKIKHHTAELIAITDNPAQLIERCGRTCYQSQDKITDDSAAKFVKMLGKRGHSAMLEFGWAAFHIVTDRGITHEIVRHRLVSYAQESTRFCNYSLGKFSSEITVVPPHGVRPKTEAWTTWKLACEAAERSYFAMLDAKCKPEIARSVLPTCLKTEINMACNLREWQHFLALRLRGVTGPPHPDMREVAWRIWLYLVDRCPEMFEQFREAADSHCENYIGWPGR